MTTTPHVDHSAVAENINESINYTMYAVFREERQSPAFEPADAASRASDLLQQIEGIESLTVRGWYDVSGFRADADLLVWLHAPSTEALQRAYRTIYEGAEGRLEPVCTVRPSSTARMCPRFLLAMHRRGTSASTHSCAATSGTC